MKEIAWEDIDPDEDFVKLEETVESLANQVRNLANKLEEHMYKPDAHNPGILRKK